VATTTVWITEQTRATLRELAEGTGTSMQDVLATAVEAYRRQQILEATNTAFAALRSDPEAWKEALNERTAWDATLADGLGEP
jgi:hypothetical protein